MRGYPTIDERHAAEIDLEGLTLPADALLGEVGQAHDALIAPVMDEAVAALCSEAVGVLRELHAQTLDYARQRPQGRPLSAPAAPRTTALTISVTGHATPITIEPETGLVH